MSLVVVVNCGPGNALRAHALLHSCPLYYALRFWGGGGWGVGVGGGGGVKFFLQKRILYS